MRAAIKAAAQPASGTRNTQPDAQGSGDDDDEYDDGGGGDDERERLLRRFDAFHRRYAWKRLEAVERVWAISDLHADVAVNRASLERLEQPLPQPLAQTLPQPLHSITSRRVERFRAGAWLEQVAPRPTDALLIAGDVSHEPATLSWALSHLVSRWR